jgi:type I restriction-modification system DNA methylase subunit
MNHSETTHFIWNIANLIRDSFRRSKYPDAILPFTVLRRIDAVPAPHQRAGVGKQRPLPRPGGCRRPGSLTLTSTSFFS